MLYMLIDKKELKSLKKAAKFLTNNKFYITLSYINGLQYERQITCNVGMFEDKLFIDFFGGNKYIYSTHEINNVFLSLKYIVIEFIDNSFIVFSSSDNNLLKIYNTLVMQYNIPSVQKDIKNFVANLNYSTISQQPINEPTEYSPSYSDKTDCSSSISNNLDAPQTKDAHIVFPDWYISICFGKSSSENYMKAVTLAKQAPQYHTQTDNGIILHQAIYSSAPQEYLAFISLYELVSTWKSSFTIINGKVIDRNIIGKLNYCYGDKCRSGDPHFCYGASYMTENPFGCHRLQVSAANNPWWSFYRRVGNNYILNQMELKKRIDSYASVYCLCPCFNYQQIIQAYNSLPIRLTQYQYNRLSASNWGLRM